MATYVQIILTLVYVVLTEGHFIDPFGLNLNLQNFNVPKRDDDRHYTTSSVNDMPVNGDIYSYKYKKNYDNYYSDGNGFNKALNPYFGYPGTFNRPNFDNIPLNFGLPNMQNKFPGPFLPPQIMNIMGDRKTQLDKFEKNHGISSTESSDNKKDNSENSENTPESVNDNSEIPPHIDTLKSEEQNDKSEKPVNLKPKTNEAQNDNPEVGEAKKNVTLSPMKDYILVDNNGNTAYLLHEDNPNRAAPNNNQPGGNNIMYLPVTANKNTVQPPYNQYYQLPNGQPSLSTNIPLTGNSPTSNLPITNQPGLNNVIYVPLVSNTNNPQQPNNQYYKFPYGQPSLSTNIALPGNIPTSNVPINNQPGLNNGVYVPLVSNTNNPQYPNNHIYQVVNGQPISMNIPITGNGLNPNGYNNILTNFGQNNPLSNNYNPNYIYIYANGQLTQIPGYVINPQQNAPIQSGYNNILTTSVPNYSGQTGYTPTTFQMPTVNTPVSNNYQQSGVVPQNPQPNNNLGFYNTQSGYAQANMSPNYNTPSASNNPGLQPSVAYPGNSNGNNNQQLSPTSQKDTNLVGSPQNDIPIIHDSPKTSQVVPETPVETKNYFEAQPAIMFTDFKEKDDEKDNSKEIDNKEHEEDAKEKKETDS